jgi:hypothetical protein
MSKEMDDHISEVVDELYITRIIGGDELITLQCYEEYTKMKFTEEQKIEIQKCLENKWDDFRYPKR